MDSEKLSIRFQKLPDITIYIFYNFWFIDVIICQIEKAFSKDAFFHAFQIFMFHVIG